MQERPLTLQYIGTVLFACLLAVPASASRPQIEVYPAVPGYAEIVEGTRSSFSTVLNVEESPRPVVTFPDEFDWREEPLRIIPIDGRP